MLRRQGLCYSGARLPISWTAIRDLLLKVVTSSAFAIKHRGFGLLKTAIPGIAVNMFTQPHARNAINWVCKVSPVSNCA